MRIKRRPYQIECEKAIMDAGPGRHLVVLATGLGKTVIFTHLKNMGRVLILSHRDELVRQPEKYYPKSVRFGVEKAEEHASKDDMVVSASVQSLSQDSRLKNYPRDFFETIIVDEAHHCAAPTYKKILEYFTEAERVLGFTATPRRGDNVALSSVFQDIIFSRDIRWGIKNGYLTNIRCEEVTANFDIGSIEKSNGDYNTSQLEEVFLNSKMEIIPMAAKAYIEKCHNTGRHTLLYCVTKNICTLLLKTVREMLPAEERNTVQMILGDTPDEERTAILNKFQSGEVKCIINCMVLTEGTDLPICDAIMNLRPTCRNTLYQQMVGRGTRLYDGKEYCLVVDVVPNDTYTTRRTLCTAPSLFGIDAAALSEKERKELTEKTDLLMFCDKISGIYAEKSEQIELFSKSVDLFIEECDSIYSEGNNGITGCVNAYKELDEKKCSASTVDFGDLRVEVFPDEREHYLIRPDWSGEIWMSEPDVLNNVTVRFPKKGSENGICGTMNVDDAVELIGIYCKTMPDYYAYCWSKEAQKVWMKQEATEAQIGKLYSVLGKKGVRITSKDKLNKLDASNLIGLTVRYDDKKKFAKKLAETISAAKSGKNTKKAQRAKDEMERLLNERANRQETSDVNAFESFVKEIHRQYDEKCKWKEMREQEKKMHEQQALDNAKNNELVITLSMYPARGRQASTAQKSYIESLRNKTGLLKDANIDKVTARQASLMISFLKKVQDMPQEVREMVEYPDALSVCASAEHAELPEYHFMQVMRKNKAETK